MILARADQKVAMDSEVEVYRSLKGLPGVVMMHSYTTHKEKNKPHYTLYLDLYSHGSLSYFIKNKLPLTTEEAVSIIYQLSQGIESMHKQNIVHRDLHIGNCLVSMTDEFMPTRKFKAVIADLGRATPLERAKGLKAQGACLFRPPEGWLYESMEGRDYLASDIYALGCVFYQLLHTKLAPWQQKKILKDKKKSFEFRREFLLDALYNECEVPLQNLLEKQKQRELTPDEALDLLIFSMVQIDPNHRINARELRERAEAIQKQI